MILRKPYALFIKYFRLINLAMAVLMGILIYRTWVITGFLNSYIGNYLLATDDFVLGHYINFYSFIMALIIVILNVVILSVLFVKKKPKKLYIFSGILYILIIVMYGVDYMILHGVNEVIWDVRLTKAVRDFTYVGLALQAACVVLVLIRATGFDIKGFNFGTDLQELDIQTEDNEEFEVAVEFDQNKIERKVRKGIRYVSYFYLEHKLLVNVCGIILVIIIAFTLFINRMIYRADYKQGHPFQASGVVVNIKQAFITSTDQFGEEMMYENGKKTKNRVLLVLKLDVKSVYNDPDAVLNTGLFNLRIRGRSYGQTTSYNKEISDMGTPYVQQKLTTDFKSYLLAFDLPRELANKKMVLKFNDNISYVKGELGAKNIYVTLKQEDLDKDKDEIEAVSGKTLSFKGSLLENAKLKIDKVEVAKSFKTDYNFCYSTNKCYKSYEYVTPTTTGTYFKTVMKVKGTFESDQNANISGIATLNDFLNKFAVISYQKNGGWYSHKIDSENISPAVKEPDTYYIEVNKNVEGATTIYLLFKVRNYNYKYVLM